MLKGTKRNCILAVLKKRHFSNWVIFMGKVMAKPNEALNNPVNVKWHEDSVSLVFYVFKVVLIFKYCSKPFYRSWTKYETFFGNFFFKQELKSTLQQWFYISPYIYTTISHLFFEVINWFKWNCVNPFISWLDSALHKALVT